MEFEEIYRSYFKDVYLYLKSLSGKEQVAEELTQEAFVKALKSIDRFDGKKDIRAWLFTIAKNTYFSYRKLEKQILQDDILDRIPDSNVHFEETLENDEQAFLIHQFLHKMKDPYKEVFSLRIFGELSFEKIAKIFGKSPGWARVTYYRAKKQIMEYMEGLEHG